MHSDTVLVALTLGLAAAVVALVIFRRIGFGSILGLIAAGIAVGPFGLAIGGDGDTLHQVTELGIVFLLFVIGLEMEPRRLWAMRYLVFGLGGLQILLTALVVFVIFVTLAGIDVDGAILAALGLALSSTAFGVKLLEERNELRTPHGRHTFSVLLMQDVSVVPILALVPLLAGHGTLGAWSPTGLVYSLLSLGAIAVLGLLVLPGAFELAARQRNKDAFTALAALGVLAAATATGQAGMSQALGAFLLGMLLSRSRYHHQIEAEVEPFKGWLLSLFFVSVGMSIDLDSLVANWAWVLMTVLLIVLAKFAVMLVLGRLFGLDWPAGIRTAVLLSQGGEFGFVLFEVARMDGLFDAQTHTLGILIISVSMATTPLLVRLADMLVDGRAPAGDDGDAALRVESGDHDVLVAGHGRVGNIVCDMLAEAGISYLAADIDPHRVHAGRAIGHNVAYGNTADPRFLEAAGASKARAVVVTLDTPIASERVISTIRTFDPDIMIIARARDTATARRLRLAGASETFPEVSELAIALGAQVLRGFAQSERTIEDIAGLMRINMGKNERQ